MFCPFFFSLYCEPRLSSCVTINRLMLSLSLIRICPTLNKSQLKGSEDYAACSSETLNHRRITASDMLQRDVLITFPSKLSNVLSILIAPRRWNQRKIGHKVFVYFFCVTEFPMVSVTRSMGVQSGDAQLPGCRTYSSTTRSVFSVLRLKI